MAKTKADTVRTVIVRSNVNTGGLVPGEQAEVEDNEKTRELVNMGLWTLLVPVQFESAPVPSNDVPSVPNGDTANTEQARRPNRDPDSVNLS